jgi:predicted transcriptional regulator
MTKLLDKALEAVRVLPADAQDDIARILLQLAGTEHAAPAMLSHDERAAIAASRAAAANGEFASEEEVRSVWAKYGL